MNFLRCGICRTSFFCESHLRLLLFHGMCILVAIRIMKGEAWMTRRMVCLLAAAVVLVGFSVPAKAAEQTGEIRVSLNYSQLPVSRGTVVLHYVAEPAQGGYRLTEALGGGIVRKEDAHSPDLAQWLEARTGEEGTAQFLDADGNAVFSELEEGLYLLTQTEAPEGCACAEPFLIPLPLDGQWEIQAYPKTTALLTESPRTGQHPAPLIGAMGLVLSGTGLYFCLEKLRKK